MLVALMMAVIVSALAERRVTTDALLGVMAHGALAFGLGLLGVAAGRRAGCRGGLRHRAAE